MTTSTSTWCPIPRKVYRQYGVERGKLAQFLAPGAGLKSLKATLRGHLHGKFEGDELQLPGDFVINEEGVIVYAHRGSHIGDNTPLEKLLGIVRDGETLWGQAPVSRRGFIVGGAVAAATVTGAGGGLAYYNHAVDSIGTYEPDQVSALYAGRTNGLFQAYPGLKGKLPWMPIGTYPTPVEPMRMPDGGKAKIFVKRDDLTSPLYGGNKVRKLEHVMAEAKLAGRKSLLTIGGLGSNQCLATTLHGKGFGFEVDICLFDQPVNKFVRRNLLADAKGGANFVYGGGFVTTAYRAARRYSEREAPYYIPAGATTPLGNIGYVTAAFELAEQIKAGKLPEPDRIYVAAGSCGTAAGLAVGCKLAGLASKIVAVRITEPIVANEWNIRRVAQQTADALRRMDPELPALRIEPGDIEVETEFFGGSYGVDTPESAEAIEWAKPHIELESTYTGKAMAACIDHCRKGRPDETVLFWNTYNSAPLDLADNVDALPPEIRKILAAG